jgi:hypothetical protein
VKILVRYGARIAYTIQDDDGRTLIRDGISLAHRFPEVQQWLLVGQYTSRKFLGRAGDTASSAPEGRERPWAGVWKGSYVLQGTYHEAPRGLRETREMYLKRTSRLRRSLRGKVVPVALDRRADITPGRHILPKSITYTFKKR